jgi:hypothetical protein
MCTVYRQSKLIPAFLLLIELVFGVIAIVSQRSWGFAALTVLGGLVIVYYGIRTVTNRRLEVGDRIKYFDSSGDLVLDAGWDDVTELYTSTALATEGRSGGPAIYFKTNEGNVDLFGLLNLDAFADSVRKQAPRAKVSDDLGNPFSRPS